jgi:hypothetical protein
VVESLLPKQVVVGSNPITRSFPIRITKTGRRGPVLFCYNAVRSVVLRDVTAEDSLRISSHLT